MITALLPIKDQSERVPDKNFRMLAGKPLYRHILDTLLGMDEIDRVIINTDSERIPYEHHGRVVMSKRKDRLIGHSVDMNRIIEDDLGAFDSDTFIQTHATNPFLTATAIRSAIFLAQAEGKPVFSVDEVKTRFYDAHGRAINHNADELLPTQDLKPIYRENSCIYVFTRDQFMANRNRIGPDAIMLPIPPIESLDIDTEDDFKLAEALA